MENTVYSYEKLRPEHLNPKCRRIPICICVEASAFTVRKKRELKMSIINMLTSLKEEQVISIVCDISIILFSDMKHFLRLYDFKNLSQISLDELDSLLTNAIASDTEQVELVSVIEQVSLDIKAKTQDYLVMGTGMYQPIIILIGSGHSSESINHIKETTLYDIKGNAVWLQPVIICNQGESKEENYKFLLSDLANVWYDLDDDSRIRDLQRSIKAITSSTAGKLSKLEQAREWEWRKFK